LSTANEEVDTRKAGSKKRDKFFLFTGIAIFGIGQSMLFVLFGPLAREMGLSEIQFGLLFTISNLGLVFAAPFWGRKTDSAGRKPVFIVGLLGTAAGMLALALAIQVGLWNILPIWGLFCLLLAARFVYSLTAIAVYPASGAYMADITSREDRARGMALIGGANSMGAILGPAIGGGLAFIHILFPMYAASALALAGAVMAMYLLVEPERSADSMRPSTLKFTDKRLVPFLIMWVAFFIVFTTLQFITAFYIQDRFGITESKEVVKIAALAMVAMGGTNVVVQMGLIQFFRIRAKTLLCLCFPFVAAGLLLLAFAPSLKMIFPAYMFIGLAFSMANPGISGGASLSVEPHEQGTASGYLAAATTAGVIFGPLLGTSLYQFSPSLPLLMGAGLAVAMAIFAFFVHIPDPRSTPR